MVDDELRKGRIYVLYIVASDKETIDKKQKDYAILTSKELKNILGGGSNSVLVKRR